jgi:hypothetical protein
VEGDVKIQLKCAAVALAAGMVSPAFAAKITSTTTKEGKVIIALNGEITEGDAESLKAQIKTANDANRLVSGIRFNSPGGILVEGVKLAEIVRYAKMATIVANGSQCASACFVAFAAGAEKFVSYTANVGVHGASDQSGRESGDATVSMARVVKELGVPAGIIGKMVVTRPEDIVWLTPDDLRSMGTTMTGKPAQAPPDDQANSRPLQLGPSTGATAIAPQTPAPKSRTWNELVDEATAISAQQNGGKPNFGRTCQPEQKVCITALFFKGKDGTEMMMKGVENMVGKLIGHEICSFNSFGDVRTCVDWESKATHRDMQDSSGNWKKVADE